MSSELPDLPAVTTLDGDELFYVVDDPAGTPTDGKITADDVAAFMGGGGAVASVNGETGVVVLDAGDVGADPAGTATTAVAAEAALARNADNLTSGTVADARVASTIARDTEVTAAVAVEEAARIAADALKANAANPIFTGTVTIPDGALTIADTNGLQTALDAKANAANPVFTGTVTIPDAALAIADTSGLQAALDAKAPLASPALTGNPTAPTPSPGDADTSIATTAFVDAAVDAAAVQISDLSTVTPLWVLAEDASEVTGKWNPLTHDVHTETANYTLALTDVDGIVLMNNASSRSITYPQDSDVPIPVGSSGIIASIQGTVTHTAGTGATVPLASEGILATNGAWCYWLKTAANTFQILSPSGYLTAHNLAFNHALIATALQASSFTYSTYTPSFAQSGALTTSALVGRYCQVGKHVHAWGSATFSNTGTTANPITVSLPVNAHASVVTTTVGTGRVTDSGTNTWDTIMYVGSATLSSFLDPNQTAAGHNRIGQTPAFAVASGDSVIWNITYESV